MHGSLGLFSPLSSEHLFVEVSREWLCPVWGHRGAFPSDVKVSQRADVDVRSTEEEGTTGYE
jgi:hypothetical protein